MLANSMVAFRRIPRDLDFNGRPARRSFREAVDGSRIVPEGSHCGETTAPNSANTAPERVFIRCAVSCNAENGFRDNHSLPTPIAKQTIADPCWRAGRLSRLLAGLVEARAAVGVDEQLSVLFPASSGQNVRCCRVIRWGP